MEMMQIVQVDQWFVFYKFVFVGDKLWVWMDIYLVDEWFGVDIVVIRNFCINDDGELVMEVYIMLMGQQGDGFVRFKWDKEFGQVIRIV